MAVFSYMFVDLCVVNELAFFDEIIRRKLSTKKMLKRSLKRNLKRNPKMNLT